MEQVQVLAMRHGLTRWNVLKKIQGHRDEPLSAQGIAALRGWQIPARFVHFDCVSSPLARCTHTAALLSSRVPVLEPRIMEMDWGEWEGWSLERLRRRAPEEMFANEARGLDFRPRGGESPREVSVRVQRWLVELARSHTSVVMFSHKGVVRALLSLALDWDMKQKPPIKLDWHRCHLFEVSAAGGPSLLEPNIALELMS
ncbi:MAG: broad specificity phosphatase PhoE [Gammaproteobacteria bacterium]|jgi:broad specificity phosphatase PhoE